MLIIRCFSFLCNLPYHPYMPRGSCHVIRDKIHKKDSDLEIFLLACAFAYRCYIVFAKIKIALGQLATLVLICTSCSNSALGNRFMLRHFAPAQAGSAKILSKSEFLHFYTVADHMAGPAWRICISFFRYMCIGEVRRDVFFVILMLKNCS